jgi:hypothetical protein
MGGKPEMGSEERGNGAGSPVRQRFLARSGVNFDEAHFDRVIFNGMLNCSACP